MRLTELDEQFFNAMAQEPRVAYHYVICLLREHYKIRDIYTKQDWERIIHNLLADLHEEVE